MKFFAALAILFTATVWMTGADTPAGVVYADHDKVAVALAKGGPLATTPGFVVMGNHRNGPAGSEMHEGHSHVFYVTDGTATIVLGGTIVDSKTTEPGEIRGSKIDGGTEQKLSKGDVIVIPPGTPHWWKETSSFSYFVVNVNK